MYNRYTPTQDGSYRRNRIPDPAPPPPPEPPVPSPPAPEPVVSVPSPPPQTAPAQLPMKFLTDLLPRDMDSGDMLVLLILFLLMADGSEAAADPLLTLALFFLVK